ncbi:Uncharacterised protein [Sphingobacterium multivorum]|jgi:hypothetical protein|uniref:Uncharacterized protein n=2 Tax=Sphingobacteriaceae TaxID=84566 RepID=A0A2X2IN25_SPHMU|nr:Uncharacterised protein [Sphingobacterium multivorum]
MRTMPQDNCLIVIQKFLSIILCFDQINHYCSGDTEYLGFYAGINIFVTHIFPEFDKYTLHSFFG